MIYPIRTNKVIGYSVKTPQSCSSSYGDRIIFETREEAKEFLLETWKREQANYTEIIAKLSNDAFDKYEDPIQPVESTFFTLNDDQ